MPSIVTAAASWPQKAAVKRCACEMPKCVEKACETMPVTTPKMRPKESRPVHRATTASLMKVVGAPVLPGRPRQHFSAKMPAIAVSRFATTHAQSHGPKVSRDCVSSSIFA